MQLQNLTPNGKSLVTTGDFELGQVQLVQVEPELYVLNMLAQVAPTWEAPPIRYDALDTCLMRAESMAHVLGGASVHMPRIGTGLSRGKWEQIEPLILKNFAEREVYVYDLD
jgi:O-acetyl-ADP-ribose deacetylase (regulator of RNase III)